MPKYIDEVYVYTDGGCHPNPGTMVGACLISDGDIVLKGPLKFTFGQGTNVVAEFKAIEQGLDEATAFTRKKVHVCCDNEFAVMALNKERRITKAKHLRPVLSSVYQKAALFESVDYMHVRGTNKFVKKCDSACREQIEKIS